MRWIVASDHAGYTLKVALTKYLTQRGEVVHDIGTHSLERTDYPDWGHRVGEAVAKGEYERGLVVCGSGIGISIAVNRHRGARAALCHDDYTARMSRAHNDANVLALGERVVGLGVAESIVDAFLATAFEGGRHADRLCKIDP